MVWNRRQCSKLCGGVLQQPDSRTYRRQVVYVGKTEFDHTALQFGVPRGSVLGPRVFVQYAEDVDDIFQRHGVHHQFADDMQGHCNG